MKCYVRGLGAGSTYTDWLHLPTEYDKDEFARIQAAAKINQTQRFWLLLESGAHIWALVRQLTS